MTRKILYIFLKITINFEIDAWEVLGKTPGHTSTRAMRLLSDRALELRQSIHEEFDIVWNALVNIDIADRTITIQDNQKGKGAIV